MTTSKEDKLRALIKEEIKSTLTEIAKRPKTHEDWGLVKQAAQSHVDRLVNAISETMDGESESLADTLSHHYNLNLSPDETSDYLLDELVHRLAPKHGK